MHSVYVDDVCVDLASYVRLAGSGGGVEVHEQQRELLLQLLGMLPVRLQQQSLVVQRQSVPSRRDGGDSNSQHANRSRGRRSSALKQTNGR